MSGTTSTSGRGRGPGRLILGTVLALLCQAVAADTAVHYRLVKSVPLGSPDHWDLLHYDPPTHRVFVTHQTEVTVVDGRSGVVIGRLPGIGGAHGVDLGAGKGFADNGERGSLTIFDPATLKPLGEVKADADADDVVYDPASRRVFVMNGDPQDASAIDAADGRPIATLALGGKPESAVVDGAGKLYVNIKDQRQLVRIDTRSVRIDARWPIDDCQSPHGLAIDTASRRLFSSCMNSKLLVVDARDGRVVAELPIGRGTDSAAFDPVRKLAFSSNGDGTLSVIAERAGDQFVSLGEVPTAPGARTMALDPETGRVFVVTGEVAGSAPPKEPGHSPRFDYMPGSVKLLMFDPVP